LESKFPIIDKKSTVLNIICSYNEYQYLPNVVRYYEREGVDVVVADNYSDDATWEWLNDNGVPCFRFDTNGEFNLLKQQALRKEAMAFYKEYEWIIYGDADEYLVSDISLIDLKEKAIELKKSAVSFPCLEMLNTGEVVDYERRKEATNTYEYYMRIGRRHRFFENSRTIRFYADFIKTNQLLMYEQCVVLNYGRTKPKYLREESLARRKKAWENGLPKLFGEHYLDDSKVGWLWDKKDFDSIKDHNMFDIIYKKVIKENAN
jgi:hypothetical protein